MESRDKNDVIVKLKEIVTDYQSHLEQGESKIKKSENRGTTQNLFRMGNELGDTWKANKGFISFIDVGSAAEDLKLKQLITAELLKALNEAGDASNKLDKFIKILDKWKAPLQDRRGQTGLWHKDLLFVNEKQIVDALPSAVVPKAFRVTGGEMVAQVESLLEPYKKDKDSDFVQVNNIFIEAKCSSISEQKSSGCFMLKFDTPQDADEFCQRYRDSVNPSVPEIKSLNTACVLLIEAEDYSLLRSIKQDKVLSVPVKDSQKDLEQIQNLTKKLKEFQQEVSKEKDFLDDVSDGHRKMLRLYIADDGLKILNSKGCASIKLKKFTQFFSKKQERLERLQDDSITRVLKDIAEFLFPRAVTSRLFAAPKEATKVVREIGSDLRKIVSKQASKK